MTNDKLSILKNKYLSEGHTGYKVVDIHCPEEGTDCSDYITGIIENAGDHTIFSLKNILAIIAESISPEP